MSRYLSGLFVCGLGLCAGGWLVVTAVVLRGAPSNASLVTLGTGAVVALVSVTGLVCWAVAWRQRMRRDGVLTGGQAACSRAAGRPRPDGLPAGQLSARTARRNRRALRRDRRHVIRLARIAASTARRAARAAASTSGAAATTAKGAGGTAEGAGSTAGGATSTAGGAGGTAGAAPRGTGTEASGGGAARGGDGCPPLIPGQRLPAASEDGGGGTRAGQVTGPAVPPPVIPALRFPRDVAGDGEETW